MAEINKCPACGALRTSFAAVCPECGYEFPQVNESASVQKFADQINEIDQTLDYSVDKKSGIGCVTIFLWIAFFPVMLILFYVKTMSKYNKGFEGNEKKKANAINLFPILNTRSDLIESALLFETQVKSVNIFSMLTEEGNSVQRWNKVWLDKFTQIVKKSDMSLKGDPEALKVIHKSYDNAKAIVDKNHKNKVIVFRSLTGIFVAFMLLMIIGG